MDTFPLTRFPQNGRHSDSSAVLETPTWVITRIEGLHSDGKARFLENINICQLGRLKTDKSGAFKSNFCPVEQAWTWHRFVNFHLKGYTRLDGWASVWKTLHGTVLGLQNKIWPSPRLRWCPGLYENHFTGYWIHDPVYGIQISPFSMQWNVSYSSMLCWPWSCYKTDLRTYSK